MSNFIGPRLPIEMTVSLRGGQTCSQDLPECSNDLGILSDAEALRALKAEPFAQVAVVDGAWNILTVNSGWVQAVRFEGWTDLQQSGANLADFFRHIRGGDRSGIEVMLRGIRAIDAKSTNSFLESYRSAVDGRHFQISISVFEAAGRRYATVSRLNLTELVHLREQNSTLCVNLMRGHADLAQAREDERQRVARELHDTAAQHLAGVNLGLARLLASSSDPVAIMIAREIGDLLDKFHSDIRGVTYVLHPPELRLCGLHEAVRSLCGGLARRSGLDILTSIFGIDSRRETPAEAAIYRIVQEALANIHRHAHAKHVRLRLESREDVFLLVIGDDGVGLPEGWISQPASGVGVAAMMKRTAELGGRFDIRSPRNRRGTKIAAAIPRRGGDPSFMLNQGLAAAAG